MSKELTKQKFIDIMKQLNYDEHIFFMIDDEENRDEVCTRKVCSFESISTTPITFQNSPILYNNFILSHIDGKIKKNFKGEPK